jgi:hypothetical protein
MIRFLVMNLTHPDLNSIFDISVIFITNYSFKERQRLHQQRYTLDDLNFKIKPTQSFKNTHRDRIYVLIYIFIEVSAHMDCL